MTLFTIISLIILIMSVVLHELAHGYVAELLGDPTPRLQGRLTVNPLKHLEWFGSFIVPVITSLSGFTFGWAKPIQWNPYNIKNRRTGELLISLAGPAANLFLAIIFGIVVRYAHTSPFALICAYIVVINISLAVFNLIPLPPLDGSKILFSLLPPRLDNVRTYIEKYSLFLVLILVVFLWKYVEPIIPILFWWITGYDLA